MDLVLLEQGDLGWVFPSPLPPNLGAVSQKAEAANDSVEKAFSQGWQAPKHPLGALRIARAAAPALSRPCSPGSAQSKLAWGRGEVASTDQGQLRAETWWDSYPLHGHTPHPGTQNQGPGHWPLP